MFVVNGVVVPQRGERRVAACVEGVNDAGAGSSRGAYIRPKSNVGRGQTRSRAKAGDFDQDTKKRSRCSWQASSSTATHRTPTRPSRIRCPTLVRLPGHIHFSIPTPFTLIPRRGVDGSSHIHRSSASRRPRPIHRI
ncbi:hypothetical protein GALMADRAFT_1141233 [Galerina marginata CBS 339.88]|uniref:Uncharacterized protein n=1 Tax=Galerina marginata (strain CBS 339.88) TaxID=685588 RepID=A0A067SA60_GALM3|nr:hypothetical protein GALMADRAFT_1141233 [Galerina marginata CBS 339.88]